MVKNCQIRLSCSASPTNFKDALKKSAVLVFSFYSWIALYTHCRLHSAVNTFFSTFIKQNSRIIFCRLNCFVYMKNHSVEKTSLCCKNTSFKERSAEAADAGMTNIYTGISSWIASRSIQLTVVDSLAKIVHIEVIGKRMQKLLEVKNLECTIN